MIVGVLKEPISGEKRVAATPESVKQLIGKGLKVSIDAISEQVSFEEGTDADKIGLVYIERGEDRYLENYVTVHEESELNDIKYINSEHLRISRFFRYDEKFCKRWEKPKLKAFEKWLESVPEGTDDSIFEKAFKKLKR